MQESTTLVSFKESLLIEIKRRMKGRRVEFCKLLNISEGNLSKILNLKVNCSDELLDYMCQFCDLQIFAEYHRTGYCLY